MGTNDAPQVGRWTAPSTVHRDSANVWQRGLLRSDMPLWTMLVLVALGLPRTVLTDLGILEPEGSLTYYFAALIPYAVWLSVAVFRRTLTPLRDHILTGALYGLSLVLVHEVFWNVETSQGNNPPQGAIDLASRFDSPIRELIVHGSEFSIAMMIGLGSGVVMAVIGFVATRIRMARERQVGRF